MFFMPLMGPFFAKILPIKKNIIIGIRRIITLKNTNKGNEKSYPQLKMKNKVSIALTRLKEKGSLGLYAKNDTKAKNAITPDRIP